MLGKPPDAAYCGGAVDGVLGKPPDAAYCGGAVEGVLGKPLDVAYCDGDEYIWPGYVPGAGGYTELPGFQFGTCSLALWF